MSIIDAAKQMDWQQVVQNGGPPCFHLCADGRFCGRAKRWEGHEGVLPKLPAGPGHQFVPLDKLLATLKAQRDEAIQGCRDALTALYTPKGLTYKIEVGNRLKAIIAAVEKEGK